MPQISSNRISQPASGDTCTAFAEVTRFLESLTQTLDQEICSALLEENNALAERLNIPFMQARKLAGALAAHSNNLETQKN